MFIQFDRFWTFKDLMRSKCKKLWICSSWLKLIANLADFNVMRVIIIVIVIKIIVIKIVYYSNNGNKIVIIVYNSKKSNKCTNSNNYSKNRNSNNYSKNSTIIVIIIK